jgi:hypothetical protein
MQGVYPDLTCPQRYEKNRKNKPNGLEKYKRIFGREEKDAEGHKKA